jgi:hypothetical protein
MGKTLATQRSLNYLRRLGWTACIVEKWIPPRGKMKFGVRIDAFGFGDLLACSPLAFGQEPRPGGSIALVQTFPLARWKDHEAKILAIPEFQKWKEAGGIVLLHGWAFKPKDGIRGNRKVWTLREQIL